MKAAFVVMLLIMCCFLVEAQPNYYVTSIKGKVFRADSIAVKVGMKLSENEMLTFSTQTDQLILLGSTKGRIIISPKNGKTPKNNKLTALLKDFLLLNATVVRLSAVSGRKTKSTP